MGKKPVCIRGVDYPRKQDAIDAARRVRRKYCRKLYQAFAEEDQMWLEDYWRQTMPDYGWILDAGIERLEMRPHPLGYSEPAMTFTLRDGFEDTISVRGYHKSHGTLVHRAFRLCVYPLIPDSVCEWHEDELAVCGGHLEVHHENYTFRELRDAFCEREGLDVEKIEVVRPDNAAGCVYFRDQNLSVEFSLFHDQYAELMTFCQVHHAISHGKKPPRHLI